MNKTYTELVNALYESGEIIDTPMFDPEEVELFEENQRTYHLNWTYNRSTKSKRKGEGYKLPRIDWLFNRKKLKNMGLIMVDFVKLHALAVQPADAIGLVDSSDRIFMVRQNEDGKMTSIFLWRMDLDDKLTAKYARYGEEMLNTKASITDNFLIFDWERGTSSRSILIELGELINIIGPFLKKETTNVRFSKNK